MLGNASPAGPPSPTRCGLAGRQTVCSTTVDRAAAGLLICGAP
jgi:hypothetical protein